MLVPEKMANWILSETEKVTDLKLRTWIFEIIFERWNMAWNSYCTLKDASWIIEMLWLKIFMEFWKYQKFYVEKLAWITKFYQLKYFWRMKYGPSSFNIWKFVDDYCSLSIPCKISSN